MPKQPTKGKTMMAAELPTELVEAFRVYARARGEKVSFAMERALRREMAYPPPPPAPPPLAPLPDSPAPAAQTPGLTEPSKGKRRAAGS